MCHSTKPIHLYTGCDDRNNRDDILQQNYIFLYMYKKLITFCCFIQAFVAWSFVEIFFIHNYDYYFLHFYAVTVITDFSFFLMIYLFTFIFIIIPSCYFVSFYFVNSMILYFSRSKQCFIALQVSSSFRTIFNVFLLYNLVI